MGNPTKESSTGTVQAPDQMTTLQNLLALLSGGGETVTTSPGDTAALQQLLAQMRGVNPADQLAAIFQQAQGAIPKFQAAYSNAVGARSGKNSAIAASLQDLLKATTIAAQNNFAQQQNQNFATQAQAGNAIANATKEQTKATKANTMTGSSLGDIAALIGLLKAGTQLTGTKTVGEMFDKVTGASSATAPAPAIDINTSAAPVISAEQPQYQFTLPSLTDTSVPTVNQTTPIDFGFTPSFDYSFAPDYSTTVPDYTMPRFEAASSLFNPQPQGLDFTQYLPDNLNQYYMPNLSF